MKTMNYKNLYCFIDEEAPQKAREYAYEKLKEKYEYENGGKEELERKIQEYEDLKEKEQELINWVKDQIPIEWVDILEETGKEYLIGLALSEFYPDVITKNEKRFVKAVRNLIPHSKAKEYKNIKEKSISN